MSDTVLDLAAVTKVYPGEPPVPVLQEVSLHVRSGEMLAIIGPSGSGKTTLLHVMGTLERVNQGSISVNGREVTGMRDGELSRLRARSIGFVFQQFFMLEEASARDNVSAALLYQGVGHRERRLRAADPRTRSSCRSRFSSACCCSSRSSRRWFSSACRTRSATSSPTFSARRAAEAPPHLTHNS